MSVKDMIKKSVLESGVFDQYNIPEMLTALIAALLFGVLIYAVYRKFYAGVIYSRSFAVTLVGMTVLTCMVTLAISTNVVISLGMVGALSIVRFRTAVKDPLDLLYLFWAITSGITAGAGMDVLALLSAGGFTLRSSTITAMRPEMPSSAALENGNILSSPGRCARSRQSLRLKCSAGKMTATLWKKCGKFPEWRM